MSIAAFVPRCFQAAALATALVAGGCSTTQTSPPSPSAADSLLVGTWRLVSFEMEVQDKPDRIFPMGRSPVGYLSFMPDGRMAVVITAEGRKPPTSDPERAALYSSMVAYAGRFRIEGEKWVTIVEASANPAWVNTEQPRAFKIAGDTLQETTPWFPRATDKIMIRVVNTYARVK